MEKRYFAAIGSSSVKTVADKYRHVAYHNKQALVTGFLLLSTSMTLNDFELPWSFKCGVLAIFSKFLAAAHI